MIFDDYFKGFYLISVHFSLLSSYGKSFWSFVYVIIYCVGAGINFWYQFPTDQTHIFSLER